MDVYRTQDPEDACEALCRQHKLVVALHLLQCPRKLPLRESAIRSTQVYKVHSKKSADPSIRAWRRTGGLYIRNYGGIADFGHCEAVLHVEAPLSIEQWEQDVMPATSTAVVYDPLDWIEHDNALIDLFPPSWIARRFWQTMEIYKARDRKPLHEAMLSMFGIPESGTVCVQKSEFYKTANITARQMGRISYVDSAILDKQRGGHYGNAVILRFPPADPRHLAFFNWIEANCPKYLHWHMLQSNAASNEFPEWKRLIRAMSYAGWIQREDEVHFYSLAAAKPDYPSYDLALRQAQVRLKEVTQFVSALPLLPLDPARSKAESA